MKYYLYLIGELLSAFILIGGFFALYYILVPSY